MPSYRMSALGVAITVISTTIGCGSSPPETEAPTTGTVVLSFSVPEATRMNVALTDPLSGPVYGDIFFAEDVGATGPHTGVEKVASVEVTKVDLTQTDPSTVTWTSGELEPHDYTFLGMFDVDSNADATDRSPDSGDPVTQPGTNDFKVVAGEEVKGLVLFNLVFN